MPADYAKATAAVKKVVMADIQRYEAGMMFKPNIPQDMIDQFAADAAKAALDSQTQD